MNPRRTKCKRGHRLVGKNLYHKVDGSRECRQCSLIRARRYKRELRAMATVVGGRNGNGAGRGQGRGRGQS